MRVRDQNLIRLTFQKLDKISSVIEPFFGVLHAAALLLLPFLHKNIRNRTVRRLCFGQNKKAKVMCHFYLALGLFAARASTSTVTTVATQIFLRLSKAPQPKLLWLKSWSSSCTTIYNYFELSWQAQIYSLAQIPQGKEIVHKMDVEIHSSKCNFGNR